MNGRISYFLAGCLFLSLSGMLSGWEIARPGWVAEFPKDHLAHPAFKTEWWYFTGNLQGENGQQYGFQVTFFRQGVNEKISGSAFAVRDLSFVHAAISDLGTRRFYFGQEVSRGNFGEAGFALADQVAWIKDWKLALIDSGGWKFSAQPMGQKIELTAEPLKEPVINGVNGVSQKAAGEGHASYYYSQTRLKMSGTLVIKGETVAVSGLGWCDREWATNQLAEDQVGWNWFSLQLDDGRDLMLYQMRRKDGTVDPASSGTLVERDGKARHLANGDFSLTPLPRKWTSPATKAVYPLDWRVEVPVGKLKFTVKVMMENQEMNLAPVAYWEGAVVVEKEGAKIGSGYVELTGYGEALKGLRGGK